VRSTLHQCVRDWSADGANERSLSYGPIIEELQLQLPVTDANINKQVSVQTTCINSFQLALSLSCLNRYTVQSFASACLKAEYYIMLLCHALDSSQ
jgi:N2227-like protein